LFYKKHIFYFYTEQALNIFLSNRYFPKVPSTAPFTNKEKIKIDLALVSCCEGQCEKYSIPYIGATYLHSTIYIAFKYHTFTEQLYYTLYPIVFYDLAKNLLL